jgi:hypothetical protein
MMAVFDATQPIKGQEAPVCTQRGRFDEQSPDLRCGGSCGNYRNRCGISLD